MLQNLAQRLGSKDSQTLSNRQRLAQDHWKAVYREWIVVQNQVTRLEAELDLKRVNCSMQKTRKATMPMP